MWKKKAMLAVYIIMLCVTVSFAWILNVQNNMGQYLELKYGEEAAHKLSIASKDIEMMAYIQKDGDWIYLGSSKDQNQSGKLIQISPEDVIPNSSVPFRIRFKNTSGNTLKVKLTLSGVVCDKSLVADEIVYVGALGSDEYSRYTDTAITPPNVYLALNAANFISEDIDGNTSTYDLVVYEAIDIPATPDGEYVELDCYFYFDAERMTNVCQNKVFFVSSFQAVQQ